jgi:alanyl-tRNA synthetase
MALFGEKYGDEVRVVSMGVEESLPYSVELCGGTHVSATGDIGLFKITSESAVAAGIRRIEAVTRDGAFTYLSEQDARMRDMSLQFKTSPAELADKIMALQNERKKLEKELAETKKSLAMGSSSDDKIKPETIGNIKLIVQHFPNLEPKELRGISSGYMNTADIVFTSSGLGGSLSYNIGVSAHVPVTVSAVQLQNTIFEIIGGKGGGRPEMAQGSSPNLEKLPDAQNAIREVLKKYSS